LPIRDFTQQAHPFSIKIQKALPIPMTHLQRALGLLFIAGGAAVVQCTSAVCAQNISPGAQQAMFQTQAEAEAAAKLFNCKGSHKMGSQWMPCANHDPHSSSAAH
jgi:hypothetical protein